jgi:hypothetical protein
MVAIKPGKFILYDMAVTAKAVFNHLSAHAILCKPAVTLESVWEFWDIDRD